MPKSKKSSSSKGRRAKPYEKKAAPKASTDPLYPAKPRNFRVGGDVRHATDLSRMVKWPRYVRIQRQRKILYQRLKVPPQIAQFTRCLSKDQGASRREAAAPLRSRAFQAPAPRGPPAARHRTRPLL